MATLRFLIGGAQKAGTSALAKLLARHPQVRLPPEKEAHIFDAPDYDESWSRADVEARFAAALGSNAEPGLPAAALCCGDATPITLLHHRFVERAWRYDPGLRWIVLLREPGERAYSHWYMQRQRGTEALPCWRALLAERARLRGHEDDFSLASPLREQSYLLRGDYARQLDQLYARFPREQVLLLRSEELAASPAATLKRVCTHLGLSAPDGEVPAQRVFEGGYARGAGYRATLALARWLLRRQRRELQRRHGIAWPPSTRG
jgi:hypothetical protein